MRRLSPNAHERRQRGDISGQPNGWTSATELITDLIDLAQVRQSSCPETRCLRACRVPLRLDLFERLPAILGALLALFCDSEFGEFAVMS